MNHLNWPRWTQLISRLLQAKKLHLGVSYTYTHKLTKTKLALKFFVKLEQFVEPFWRFESSGEFTTLDGNFQFLGIDLFAIGIRRG